MSQAGDFESEFGGDTSFNFWEPKQYIKTVKRLENGNKLCKELKQMILERAEIEKRYSNDLKKWNKDWLKHMETSAEFGTSKYGWTSFCNEAMDISEIHMGIRNRLVEEVVEDIKVWQKEHFHKATLPGQHYKEVKNLEIEFELAQKPWNKRLKRVNMCKKDYHNAIKQEKSLFNSITNAKNDSQNSQEQIKKLEEKYKKAENESKKTKLSYESALQDLDSDSTRYMEEMEKIFASTQIKEEARMEHFKTIFNKIHDVTNISESNDLRQTYQKLSSGINEINTEVDLKNWGIAYGSAMVFQIPQFEEYTPEANAITSKRKIISPATSNNNVVLKSMVTNHDTVNESNYANHQSSNGQSVSGNAPPYTTYNYSPNGFSGAPAYTAANPVPYPRHQSYDETLNPFGQEIVSNSQHNEPPTYDTMTPDNKKPGVTVRALFDYKSQDSDEISLTAGDVFEKLEDEDDQGWCKGRINGHEGLYPANYAEVI